MGASIVKYTYLFNSIQFSALSAFMYRHARCELGKLHSMMLYKLGHRAGL